MSKNFDPYLNWLGIPESERPPNHYRLLGLENFESNPELISAAGEQRTQFLQDVSSGKYVDEAQALLNQVAAAVVCLTQSQKKQSYDQQLKVQLTSGGGKTSGGQTTPPPPVAQPSIPASKTIRRPVPTKPARATGSPARKPVKVIGRKKKSAIPVWAFVLAIPLVGFVVIIGLMMMLPGGRAVVENSSQQKTEGSVQVPEVQPSSRPRRRNQKKTAPKKATSKKVEFKSVSDDFAKATAGQREFESVLGTWSLQTGAVINTTRDEGLKYLQLEAGQEHAAILRLAKPITQNVLLTLSVERRNKDRAGDEFAFRVEKRSGESSWQVVKAADYSNEIASRRRNSTPGPCTVIYELNDTEITELRFVCNSRERMTSNRGGVLISKVMMDPVAR